jgi:hypothetical protein
VFGLRLRSKGSVPTVLPATSDDHPDQDAKRFANRIEDAKAERLLMEVGRGT